MKRRQLPIYLLYVDLSAAFDHVVRDWLWKSIRLRFASTADTTLIDILQSLYTETKCTLDEDLFFETKSGVRQGGPESPPLFNLFIDFVMRVFMKICDKNDIDFLELLSTLPQNAQIEPDETQQQKTHRVPWIGYADDIVAFLMSIPGLQKCLDLLVQTFTRFSLKVNVSKT